MTKLSATRLLLKKQTLFTFKAREGEKKGITTDPTTTSIIMTTGMLSFSSRKK